MSFMLILAIAVLVMLIFALFAAFRQFIFKKNLKLMQSDRFVYELNSEKLKKNRILLIFENGYWEIKEEIRRKEWSPSGTMEIIDFDTNINDKRYKEFTGEFPFRNKEGQCSLKVVKEIELNPLSNPESIIKVKI